MGSNALISNTEGIGNTAIGSTSLIINAEGNYITVVGYNADVSTDLLSNASAFRYGAIVDASNKISLGKTDVTVIEGQVVYAFPSDGRFSTSHVQYPLE